MWKMSRPPGVVVSMASVSERNPTPRRVQRRDGLDQVEQRTPEPVQLPNDQHLAVAHVVERRLQPGTVGAGAGDAVLEHLDAPAAARASSWSERS